MSGAQQSPLTAEEFAKLPDPADASRMELVRGEVVVVPLPKGRHGTVSARVSRFLGSRTNSAG